jgi:hypothetical protein
VIYEIRTYDLFPRMQPEAIKRFGEAYEKRKQFSELVGFFYTDVGPLNQIIHIWPYEDLAHRQRVRAEVAKAGVWPPKIQEFIKYMAVEIFNPYPFSPLLTPGKHGPCYEMRSYLLKPDQVAENRRRWERALPKRQEYSPLSCAMEAEIGGAGNKFVHIWPYKDPNTRYEIRAKTEHDGIWPPKGDGPNAPITLYNQENKLMYPAPFSPMQ